MAVAAALILPLHFLLYASLFSQKLGRILSGGPLTACRGSFSCGDTTSTETGSSANNALTNQTVFALLFEIMLTKPLPATVFRSLKSLKKHFYSLCCMATLLCSLKPLRTDLLCPFQLCSVCRAAFRILTTLYEIPPSCVFT